MATASRYRGRLAPSPTGALHLGVARTSLLAWLFARKAGGELILRVEDLDPPRVVPGAATQIAEDLEWLGLDWDEGPSAGGPVGPYRQSERAEHYEAALARLAAGGHLFRCTCSRREVAAASSAPHGELGPTYPGTCRLGPTHPTRPHSLRFRMRAPAPTFSDGLHGQIAIEVSDDFIVRRADGLYAYQLAVVVDDIAMGVTHVVRGDDLLAATPRQLALYRALGASPPAFLHVPLVLGPDGERLAKRDGALGVRDHRARGVPAPRLVGMLAASAGFVPPGTEASPTELLADFEPGRLTRTPARLPVDIRSGR